MGMAKIERIQEWQQLSKKKLGGVGKEEEDLNGMQFRRNLQNSAKVIHY